METSSVSDPDTYTNSSSTSNNSRRNGFQFSTLSFLRAPVSTLLEYSGVLRPQPDHHEAENLVINGGDEQFRRRSNDFGSVSGSGEVSIRIIGAGEQEHVGFEESEEAIGQISGPRLGDEGRDGGEVGGGERVSGGASSSATANDARNGDGGGDNGGRDSSYQRYDIQQVARWVEQVLPFSLLLLVVFIRQHLQGESMVAPGAGQRLSNAQAGRSGFPWKVIGVGFFNVAFFMWMAPLGAIRTVDNEKKRQDYYELVMLLAMKVPSITSRTHVILAKSNLIEELQMHHKRESLEKVLLVIGIGWIELRCPFKCHVTEDLQSFPGFFVTIWITAVMFKSNDILRKQTALKGERKISVLVGISTVFMLQVIGVYWWHHNDDLLYPLCLVPPKAVPPFWHAIFIILVNDTLVRQAAMALKCMLLMYYKNGRGHNFRRQGQMLTLIEYTLLLYRALLPTPVWYRFFLNKDYGSLFSSLTTGLYLTFKLTSVVEKVQSFFTSLKALSRKDIHYGSYATLEQVNAVGDLCAICQEKMHAPIILRCKHIFCEDCVSEWFERERGLALCAGPWLELPICDPSEMDRQVYSSNYSKIPRRIFPLKGAKIIVFLHRLLVVLKLPHY
ncbi:RING/U-box superfamily protein [Actinidia rufa]|uniref:RING/U-box superfamily protein n=1 Tax=Actinidia rufa TaxID=165716 RepID=A0A7J0E6I6_9ERIC|nr:RING/U-box superfamily protein [Actinidia rufa]